MTGECYLMLAVSEYGICCGTLWAKRGGKADVMSTADEGVPHNTTSYITSISRPAIGGGGDVDQ